jgi:hypothetical protein
MAMTFLAVSPGSPQRKAMEKGQAIEQRPNGSAVLPCAGVSVGSDHGFKHRSSSKLERRNKQIHSKFSFTQKEADLLCTEERGGGYHVPFRPDGDVWAPRVTGSHLTPTRL